MKSHDNEPHTEPVHSQLDEWHQHPSSQGVPQKEHGAHANTHALLIVFAIVTVSTVVFAVIIGLFTINQVSRLKGERESAGLDALVTDALTYKQAALATQSGYGWTAEGNVRIPIDQAMQKVVDQYRESQGQ